MKWLLEEFFSHFQSVSDPARRKLLCLAVTNLLSINQTFILGELQSLMTIWTDVITELRDDDPHHHHHNETASPPPAAADGIIPDSLVYSPSQQPNGSNDDEENPYQALESPEDARRRHLSQTDEVHSLNTAAFVRGHLGNVIGNSVGREGGFRERWVDGVVDGDVLKGFGALGVM
jgi:hypothetical protein